MAQASEKLDSNSPRAEASKRPFRILLVEDDTALFEVWKAILSRVTFRTELFWSTGAASANKKIVELNKANTPIDWIICDLFISGGRTGLDLWEQHKEEFQNFLFVSGVSTEKFLSLFNGEKKIPLFLEKPLRTDLAQNTIEEIYKDFCDNEKILNKYLLAQL